MAETLVGQAGVGSLVEAGFLSRFGRLIGQDMGSASAWSGVHECAWREEENELGE